MIVIVLIGYVMMSALLGFVVLGCGLGIWCEYEEEEYGRVFLLILGLLLSILVFLMLTDVVFELYLFDGVFNWLRSEI